MSRVVAFLVCCSWAAVGVAQIQVQQAGSVFSIEPIPDTRDVVEFYGYDQAHPLSSNTGMELPRTTLLFFHEQTGVPSPALSMVMIHDRWDGNEPFPSHNRFDFSGLPDGVFYAVVDDPVGTDLVDRYSPSPPVGGNSSAIWWWESCCTDGGALSGFEEQRFCSRIQPHFFRGIDRWELVSGDARERFQLPTLVDDVRVCKDCVAVDCPELVTVECQGSREAWADVLSDGSSICNASAISIVNDVTPGGLDASGVYPVGETLVTFTGTDAFGFTGQCTTRVVVQDTQPPEVVRCATPITAECTDRRGVNEADPQLDAFYADILGSDICGSVAYRHEQPEWMPAGCQGRTSTVDFFVTDEVDLVTSCSSNVTVVDSTPPVVTCPSEWATVECSETLGSPITHAEIDAFLSRATATDLCGDVDLFHDAPSFFPAACAPGWPTLVTFQAIDQCLLTGYCATGVSVQDTTGPALTIPAPATLECNVPNGVPSTDPAVLRWLEGFAAEDLCASVAGESIDIPALLPSGCDPGRATRVGYEAFDVCANRTTDGQDLTVVDTIAPDLLVSMIPVVPLEPRPAVKECKPPTSRLFYVACGAEDVCDPAPRIAGRLIVTNHTVPEEEVCEPHIDEVPVKCGDLVHIDMLAPPCPDRVGGRVANWSDIGMPGNSVSLPSSSDLREALVRAGRGGEVPRIPTRPEDVVFVAGESVFLEVTASDNCDNARVALYDPTHEPSPLCEEWLEDDETCCPAVLGPKEKKCKPGLCGRCAPTVDPLPVVYAAPATAQACKAKDALDAAYAVAAAASCIDVFDPMCEGTCRTEDCTKMSEDYEHEVEIDCERITIVGCKNDRGFQCTVEGNIICDCACR